MQVSFLCDETQGSPPNFITPCSDRSNTNDHAESRTSHQAKQTTGKCCILAGALRWLPPPMRCLCSLLIQVIIMTHVFSDFNDQFHRFSYLQ